MQRSTQEEITIGSTLSLYISTSVPNVVISIKKSVAATPFGGEAHQLVNEVGDARLVTTLLDVGTSGVTLEREIAQDVNACRPPPPCELHFKLVDVYTV